jgi:hypothetical protein
MCALIKTHTGKRYIFSISYDYNFMCISLDLTPSTCRNTLNFLEFFYRSTALVGLGFLVIEVLGLHSDTLQSVGLVWMSDWPIAEIYIWQDTTGKHAPGGIRNRNPTKRAAASPRFWPLDYLDRPLTFLPNNITRKLKIMKFLSTTFRYSSLNCHQLNVCC